MFRHFIAVAILILSSTLALAGPDRVSVHLGSRHIDAAREFEEFNPGLFLTWDREIDWSVGAYRNSYGELSVAGTAAWPLWEAEGRRISVFGGLAWYEEAEERFGTPFGNFVPLIGFRAEQDPLFIQVIAGDGGEATAILSVGVTISIDALRGR